MPVSPGPQDQANEGRKGLPGTLRPAWQAGHRPWGHLSEEVGAAGLQLLVPGRACLG